MAHLPPGAALLDDDLAESFSDRVVLSGQRFIQWTRLAGQEGNCAYPTADDCPRSMTVPRPKSLLCGEFGRVMLRRSCSEKNALVESIRCGDYRGARSVRSRRVDSGAFRNGRSGEQDSCGAMSRPVGGSVGIRPLRLVGWTPRTVAQPIRQDDPWRSGSFRLDADYRGLLAAQPRITLRLLKEYEPC